MIFDDSTESAGDPGALNIGKAMADAARVRGKLGVAFEAKIQSVQWPQFTSRMLEELSYDMTAILYDEIRRGIESGVTAWKGHRTGELGESFFFNREITKDSVKITVEFDPDHPYAWMQEEGDGGLLEKGTSDKPQLAVPIPGRTKSGARPSDYGELTVVRSKKSPGVVMLGEILDLKSKGKNSFVPLFFLKHQIRIPPKHYVRNAGEALERRGAQVLGHLAETYNAKLTLRSVAIDDAGRVRVEAVKPADPSATRRVVKRVAGGGLKKVR